MEGKKHVDTASKANICMNCSKSTTNGCSWAKNFTPVEGWTAEWNENNGTWHVMRCPQFDKDSPDSKPEYNFQGCMNLLVRLAKDAGEEYRAALKEYERAEELGNPYTLGNAEIRLRMISQFIEGYEADASHSRVVEKKPKMKRQEAEQRYIDYVLNNPNKNSTNAKERLAGAEEKAKIIATARPCNECHNYRSQTLGCKKCNFEHCAWVRAKTHGKMRKSGYEYE